MRLLGGILAAALLAAVGAAGLAAEWRDQAHAVATCEPETIGDCVSWAVPALLMSPFVLVAMVWLVLRACWAERAGRGALLASLGGLGAVLLEQSTHARWTPPAPGRAALLVAVGVAVGAAIAGARLHPVLQVGLAVLLLVPLGLYPVLAHRSRLAAQEERLARVEVSLLVPKVDGYRVVSASPDRDGKALRVSADKGERSSMWIDVIDLPADFAPPAHCGPTASDIANRAEPWRHPTSPPCRQIGPDHWIRTEAAAGEVHLVRHGDELVLLSGNGNVWAEDFATAAETLIEVTPHRLAELTVS